MLIVWRSLNSLRTGTFRHLPTCPAVFLEEKSIAPHNQTSLIWFTPQTHGTDSPYVSQRQGSETRNSMGGYQRPVYPSTHWLSPKVRPDWTSYEGLPPKPTVALLLSSIQLFLMSNRWRVTPDNGPLYPFHTENITRVVAGSTQVVKVSQKNSLTRQSV